MAVMLQAIFHGQVQGVGFRWTVYGVAQLHGISGEVKNLDDGTVEVYAVGVKEKLEAFVEHIKNHSGAARIDSVDCSFAETNKKYEGFQITF